MSVTYEDNNNKEFTNSSHVEGRRKPTATYIYINNTGHLLVYWLPRSTPSLALITLVIKAKLRPAQRVTSPTIIAPGGNCMGIATIVAR